MNPTTGNTPQSSEAANHLIWQGQPIPCLVRAAVYENGLAAGIGVRARDKISVSCRRLSSWPNSVVPVAMEVVAI